MAIKTMEVDKIYQVRFGGGLFTVTVAKTCAAVEDWTRNVESDHSERILRNELVARISIQWKKNRECLLQVCVGGSVLIVVLRFFYRLPTPLHRFLNLSTGLTLYGLGVGTYQRRLAGGRLKIKTNFINDFLGDGDSSIANLLKAAHVSNHGECLLYLQDHSISVSDWNQSYLEVRQILHASLKAIVPFYLARFA
ncbi:unnamed protein product [Arabidopsis halleri]